MDWSQINQMSALSLPDRLSIEIESFIMDGTLKSGDRLPAERDLAASLGVSRVSIRQALHELQTRGLIDRRPGRGTIILSSTEASDSTGATIATAFTSQIRSIGSIMELRAIIEPPIAGLTAARATLRDIVQLRNLVDQMSLDISVDKYSELDRSFHQAIAQYTHNPLLSMLNEQIATFIAPSRSSTLQTKKRRRSSTEQHRRIFEAIAVHDVEGAKREADAHITSVTEEILRIETEASKQKADVDA